VWITVVEQSTGVEAVIDSIKAVANSITRERFCTENCREVRET
jgi:hypothetical protein